MYVLMVTAAGGDPRIDAVDSVTAEWLGVRPEQLIGRSLSEALPGPGAALAGFARAAISGSSASGPSARCHGLHEIEIAGTPVALQVDSICHGQAVCLTLRLLDVAGEDQPLMARCFSSAADVMVVVDPGGRVLLANGYFADALGYEPAELRGMPFLDLVHPEDLETSRDAFRAVAEGHAESGYDNRCRTKDGQYRWFRWRARPPTAPGAPVFGIARDVTEERSREGFQSLVSQALRRISQGIVLTDAQARVRWCNQTFEQMTGYTLAELEGAPVGGKLQGPETNRAEVARVRTLVKQGRPFSSELLNYRKSGEPYWVRIDAEPTVDAHGERYFLAIETDITEERAQRLELSASEARLRATLDGAYEAIYWLESVRDAAGTIRDFRFVEVNPAAERELGVDRDNLMGRTICEVFPINREGGFFEQYRRVAESREVLSQQYEIPKGHPAPGHYQQRVVPVLDGVAIFNTNVTERVERAENERRMQQQLLRAQRMEALGQLAGGIAHDFNNVLATVIMAADSLQERVQNDPEAKETVQDIRAASSRAAEFISQIMAFSRRGEAVKEALRPAEILSQSCRMLRRVLPKGVELHTKLDEGLELDADRAQLERVLTNLVTNAWHALGTEGGNIFVELAAHNHHPQLPKAKGVGVLTVSDDGPGMDRATLDRIREPFFSTKHPGMGSGLGVAVVERIATSHGGMLQIDSEPGKGTTVQVIFPSPGEEERVVPDETGTRLRRPTPAQQEKTTILFVDDEDRLRSLIARGLEREGFEVIAVGTPEQALDVVGIRGGEIDCALLDYDLPDRTGADLARELRAERPGLPVVLLTGGGVGPEVANSDDIRSVIYKPLGIAELAQELRDQGGDSIPPPGPDSRAVAT